ncbi:MAG: hypothetical protein WC263_01610 [Candidatus Micrarchaeia archaeon]|jgi:hypothetical protein
MVGDELSMGTGMMKALPIQKTEVKKAQPATEIISNSKNNRQAVKDLQSGGYTVDKVIDNKTGKEYPPPAGFWNISGFNKMEVTFVVKKNEQTETIKNNRKFTEAVKAFSEMTSQANISDQTAKNYQKMTEFVDNSGMGLKDKEQAKKCIEDKNWTGFYNILDKNNLLKDFNKWLQQQLKSLGLGDVATSTEQRVADFQQQGILAQQGNKDLDLVRLREEEAGKRV